MSQVKPLSVLGTNYYSYSLTLCHTQGEVRKVEPLSVLDNVLHQLTNSYTTHTQGVVRKVEPLSVLDNVLHLLTNSYTIHTQGVVSELEPLSVLGDNILHQLTNTVLFTGSSERIGAVKCTRQCTPPTH